MAGPRGWAGDDSIDAYNTATTAKITAGSVTLPKLSPAVQITLAGKVQVTDNCFASTATNTVTTAGTARFPHTVGVSSCDIQVVFGNYETPTATPVVDVDPATSVTFSAAFEDASGTAYAVTFGGARSVVLPGGGLVISDPLPIEVTAGQLVFVRVYQSAGTAYLNRVAMNLTNAGGFTATTDLTATNAGAVTQAAYNGWGPMAIIGTPTAAGIPKSVIIQGDSIDYGSADGFFGIGTGYYPAKPWYSGGGFWMRALSAQAGILSAALSGDEMQWFLANAGHFRRGGFTRFARYALIGYGINDLGSGARTAVQLQTDILTQANRNLARGIVKNIVRTLTPSSTSTDRFVTIANQTTAAANGNRVIHNTWVRDNGPIDATTFLPVAAGTSSNVLRFGQTGHPIAGYVEVADSVESARDSGKWATPNRVVSDGAGTSGAFAVNSATANFTTADIGSDICLVGAGVAAADLYAQIDHLNNATQAVTTVAPSTTVSAAQLIIGPLTKDGLHQLTLGCKITATAIQAPLLALLS